MPRVEQAATDLRRSVDELQEKPPPATPKDETAERASDAARLLKRLGEHGGWLSAVLSEARWYEALIPWPLAHLQALVEPRRIFTSPKTWRPTLGDSRWTTFALAMWALVTFVVKPKLANIEALYAADAAKALLTGAFLVGTILSVSVALPGQTIISVALRRMPSFAVSFVFPSLWALLTGITGATLMMLFRGLRYLVPNDTASNVLQWGALLIAIYAAIMELNALLYTVRMYILGLVLWSRAEEKKEDSDRDEMLRVLKEIRDRLDR
jgi:hypothetical protein